MSFAYKNPRYQHVIKADRAVINNMAMSTTKRLQAAARRDAFLGAKQRQANVKQGAVAALARAAMEGAGNRQVPRGFVGVIGEAKYVDVANAAYNCDSTGSLAHISIVPQGTTVNSRVGRKCELSYVQLRGEVTNGSTAKVSSWALYLVWDEQPNKALAAINAVLDGSDTYSFPKRENVQRFKIIRKWTGVCCGNNTTAAQQTSNTTVRIDEYVRLPKGLVIVPTTADTTGAMADIITGALLFVAVGNNGTAGTSAPTATLTMRVGFRDVY